MQNRYHSDKFPISFSRWCWSSRLIITYKQDLGKWQEVDKEWEEVEINAVVNGLEGGENKEHDFSCNLPDPMATVSEFLLFISMSDNESTSDCLLNLEIGSLLHVELLNFHEKLECNKL